MMRQVANAVVKAPWFRRAAVSTPVVRDLAWRFVAGESLDAAIRTARELSARGLKATLNQVGTHLRARPDAVSASEAAVEAIRRIRAEGIDANLSLKLTQIGLDIDERLCADLLEHVLEAARENGVFVRIDMEEAAYTARTLALFDRARSTSGDLVGIVLQSYLHRTGADLARLIDAGARIRLVKGGYWETGDGIYRGRAEVDRAFLADLTLLLRGGLQPAIATHDSAAIERARQVAAECGLAPSAFELQMLYGVRQELQMQLARGGYAVRCYLPYGARWWEYVLGCLRRIPGGALRQRTERLHLGGRIR
jgi:proline dehydrogenase